MPNTVHETLEMELNHRITRLHIRTQNYARLTVYTMRHEHSIVICVRSVSQMSSNTIQIGAENIRASYPPRIEVLKMCSIHNTYNIHINIYNID